MKGIHFLVHCVLCASFLVDCVLTESNLTELKPGKDDNINLYQNKMARNKTKEEILTEETKNFWNTHALDTIVQKLNQKLNFNTAKNVIFFMGDGMSIPTVSATRVYLGGEEMSLSFESFPYTGLSKTYCVDHQTADSACSATAYFGGVKANLGTVGVTAAVKNKNCTAMRMKENQVDSIARLFQLSGKKTGLVTTTRVTHASPAGIYAHTADRQWESDTDVKNTGRNSSECEDIAHQLLFGETGPRLNVILGGGRSNFLPNHTEDEENVKGKRSDGINLIDVWKEIRERDGNEYEYIWNRKQLLEIKNDTEFLLGLFNPDHMNYSKDRNVDIEPTLEEMTEAAIKVLSKHNSKGYFLFVEGGHIDLAHHFNMAHKALDETAEFAKAVKKATELVDEKDTLIIVTADHAHTMSYAGYAARGSEIFGYAGQASDNNLYPILNYANGPGYKPNLGDGTRYVPTVEEISEINYQWPTNTPKEKETHGGDDVAIYAKGPWAHLFTGVMEENVIPHLVRFAACVSSEISCEEVGRKQA